MLDGGKLQTWKQEENDKVEPRPSTSVARWEIEKYISNVGMALTQRSPL